jgi:cysteine desulfurase
VPPRVYLDWNATSPPLDAVIEAMSAAAKETWANPSSVHAFGRAARSVVEDAREAVAALFAVDARDVVLTSGGTESNNLALHAAHTLFTSRLEHPSVVRVAEALERGGSARVHWLRVLEGGTIDLADLEAALAAAAPGATVALQAVNGETGVVQPVQDAIVLSRRFGARVHVDAVQAVGKIPNLAALRADTISLAAHKIRGPKGIGALVTSPGLRVEPVLVGGSQERGVRPGTVDVVAARGFAVAAAHVSPDRHAAIAPRRDRLERGLLEAFDGARVNGAAPRVAHVTNVSVPGWAGPELVAALDVEGVACSSGSACSAGTNEPSPAILAMLGAERAASAVRFSLGETTTDDDVTFALDAITRVAKRRPSPSS